MELKDTPSAVPGCNEAIGAREVVEAVSHQVTARHQRTHAPPQRVKPLQRGDERLRPARGIR